MVLNLLYSLALISFLLPPNVIIIIIKLWDLKCGGGIEWWVGGGESPHDNCAFPEVHHHCHHHHDPLGWACWIQDSV